MRKNGSFAFEFVILQTAMRDPLNRLYQTKLALLALIFTFLGIVLLALANLPQVTNALPSLRWLPLSDLGSALFTTGLVVIAFEYVDGKDSEARAEERLRAVLSDQAPAMRDAVIQGFAFQPEDLARVSSTETLDQIAENSLAIQLGDADLAADVYRGIRRDVLRAGERWHDVRVSISLKPYRPAGGRRSSTLFAATVRWDYKTVPSEQERRFVCLSSLSEYQEESAQRSAATRFWRFRDVDTITAKSREAFELLQFSVDGAARPIRRSLRAHGQTYSAHLGGCGANGAEVVISYTYRVMIEAHGHLLHIDVDQPSRDLSVELRYDGTGIRHVNVLDYLAAGGQSVRVVRTPGGSSDRAVSVSMSGWTTPPAGIVFVWTLESEPGHSATRHGALTP